MSESNKPNNAVPERAPAKSLGGTEVPRTIPRAQIRASSVDTTNDETRAPEALKCGREVGQDDNTTEKGGGSVAIVRRGTGPRTTAGKERSKRNSLKHGILAEATVLDGESPAEFDFLLKGLRDCFHPVGMHEDLLVEGAASLYWRKRRLLAAEGAAIRLGSQFVRYDEKQQQFIEAGEISQMPNCGGLVRKITNPEILEKCLDLLADLKDAIEKNGFRPENDEAVLTTLYGDFEENHWEATLFNAYSTWSKVAGLPDNIREEGKFLSPELCKKEFLKSLSNELERLERYKKEQISVESERVKLKSRRLRVPYSLLRYSVYLDRALDRTFKQLERAQRMRLGQPVAPLIDVNVSTS